MTTNIYSGKDAYINGIPCTQSWGAAVAVTAQKYSASCVPGATNVPPGVENWTGQGGGIGAFPALLPDGTDVTFKGVTNNTSGEGALQSLNGTVMVEQTTIDFNKENGGPIQWASTFGFEGVPTEAASGAADSSFFNSVYPNALDILVAGSTIASSSLGIRSAQIVLKRQIVAFIVAGVTYRKPGNLEADISFSFFSPTLKLAALAPNNLAVLKIDLGGGAFWSFTKVRMLGKSNYVVDRQTNAVVGYTQACSWNAADAGSKGNITYNIGSGSDVVFW